MPARAWSWGWPMTRPMSGSRLSCSPRIPSGERVPPVQHARAVDFLVVVTAVCTMSNRMQGLGLTTPSPGELHEAVERLHRQGYASTEQDIRAQAVHVSAPCDRRA